MLSINLMDVCAGPQPDWDPDIVAALDDPDMNFDLDDQLEDDFILKASTRTELNTRTHTHTHTYIHVHPVHAHTCT